MWTAPAVSNGTAGNGSASAPPANGEAPPRPRRIALYSHDTLGLGHLRRNLLIAAALGRAEPAPAILLLCGAREAGAYAMPANVDCLSLPALGKDGGGGYHSRSLGVPMWQLLDIRASSIRAAMDAFDPDAFVVDKVPGGAGGELLPALAAIRARGRARCVLGLRDVLDEPASVRREWARQRSGAIVSEFFDRVWVYGDPRVYDPVREYGLDGVEQEKTRYTGYLNPLDLAGNGPGENGVPELTRADVPDAPLCLCLVGGGQDGLPLANAFLSAPLPAGTTGVVITGPFMPMAARQALAQRALGRPDMVLVEFVTDPCRLLSRAERVIGMGGYNTCCEIMAFGRPALIVPRVRPRREQLIRAERLRDRGLLDVLHPQELSPAALSRWMARPARAPAPAASLLDFGGAARLPGLLAELFEAPLRRREAAVASL